MSPRPQDVSEPTSRSRSSPPAAPLRVAVAGLGERGLVHAALISTLPRATLVGLTDPRAVARRTAIGAVKQVRASAYVSRVFSAEAARRATGGQGGGVVAHAALDLLALLIDMLGMPARVQATVGQLYGDVEDELHARLEFAQGITV